MLGATLSTVFAIPVATSLSPVIIESSSANPEAVIFVFVFIFVKVLARDIEKEESSHFLLYFY